MKVFTVELRAGDLRYLSNLGHGLQRVLGGLGTLRRGILCPLCFSILGFCAAESSPPLRRIARRPAARPVLAWARRIRGAAPVTVPRHSYFPPQL